MKDIKSKITTTVKAKEILGIKLNGDMFFDLAMSYFDCYNSN
jgi:hypothetical protein